MQPTPEHLMQGLERRARKGFLGYPLGIIAFYGHTDKIATKAVIGIVKEAGGSVQHVKKWVYDKGDLRKDVEAIKELFRYIEAHNVLSVALTPGIYYCPHEPGIDFPAGESCPLCPFWSKVKKPDLFKTAKAAAAEHRPRRILNLLTEAAQSKKTLLYGDVMETMGLAYQDAMHRQIFKQDLRAATQKSELYKHGLLISALLVYKIQHIPDDDFFLMAQELGMFTPGKDAKTAFFNDHLERIFNYYEGK
ncbi:MAG: hypothetical protein PVH87_24535 [Desulfobacteraceae bacterium]|jgi:hypothetical protein